MDYCHPRSPGVKQSTEGDGTIPLRNPATDGTPGGGTRMDTRRLIELYVVSRKARGSSKGSIANTRWALDSFSRHIGRRPLQNVGSVDLENWLESCADYAPASRRAMLSAVRCFLRWCERRKYVRRNAANDIKGPRQPRTLPRALTTGAPAKVLQACPDARARFIVICMVQQGLRCIEVSRLQVSDVDRFHQTMRITGKGGHERVLPLLDETSLALHEYLMEHPCTAGPLVRSYTRRQSLSAGSISRLVSGWMLDAGVKAAPRDGVSAHSGRHTCASDMLLGGAHLRDVQAALGHAHLATTEAYIPLVVHGLEVAMRGRSYHASYRP